MTTLSGDCRSMTITANAGPCMRNVIPSVRSMTTRAGVSANTPNARPSARTPSTQGCDW
jgi:hypothetical protein